MLSLSVNAGIVNFIIGTAPPQYIAVHPILPKVWQKAATEFPKKIIHLKVWSTIHVLSFNPKFDLTPIVEQIPKAMLYMLW